MSLADFLNSYGALLLSYAFNGAVATYAWFTRGQKRHAQELAAIRADIAKEREARQRDIGAAREERQRLEQRMSTLEDGFKHLPDKDDMHRVELTVERLEGKLGVVAKSLDNVDRLVQRVDTYLLENKSAA